MNKIFFYHAINGCDTTSTLFQKEKKCVQILDKQKDINSIVKIFYNPNSFHEEIAKNCVNFLQQKKLSDNILIEFT